MDPTSTNWTERIELNQQLVIGSTNQVTRFSLELKPIGFSIGIKKHLNYLLFDRYCGVTNHTYLEMNMNIMMSWSTLKS